MKRKIYWNMCLIALVTILLSASLTTLIYYNDLEKQMKKEVVTEARYIETAMELSGMEYLELLSVRGRNGSSNRITLIGSDGTVLYDSYKDKESLENHRSRPEVLAAMEHGVGEIIRTSDTLSEKTYYYAVRLSDNTVIRVASTTKSAWVSLVRLVPWMIAMAVFSLVLAMVLADIQTKGIVKPINSLNLDKPDEDRLYDELSPLVGRLEKQKETIQKQIDTLKEKQIEFTAITENMSEGFIVVDSRAEVVSYNSSALQILGLHHQPEAGANVNILNFNRSSQFRQAVDQALLGNHSEQAMEIGERYYQIIANPVWDGKNNRGAIIVILDITEKKGREDLRREFSANVSHELKTPLTSISGYAEIMKNGMVRQEDMGRFAAHIYTEAQRLISLVGDIIKLSQLDENAVEIDREEVELHALAAHVMERLRDNAAEKEIDMELLGKPVTVMGVGQILDEMVFNLCDNAIKYNKTGGKITVMTVRQDGHTMLSVEDTGIGVPEAEQERIFERFYRVDKSHSRQIGGTGLGLSIVKHGAIYHDARVEIHSKVDEGTRVSIIF